MGYDEIHSARLQTCLDILLKTGVLTTCKYHEHIYLDGSGDIEAAYRRGAYEFAQKMHPEFATQRDLTDEILEVYNEYSMLDECPHCGKWRDD